MGGRPVKSAKLLTPKSQTKAEMKRRIHYEDKLKGNDDKIKPSSYLNAKQKKIFKYIVEQLEGAEILGNLDIYLLEQTAISIERLQSLEASINENAILLYSQDVMRARNAYASDFKRYCNELSLSPQSRAKLGNINLMKEQESGDPLLRVLAGGKLG